MGTRFQWTPLDNMGQQIAKKPENFGVSQTRMDVSGGVYGGYGWTRTTDPSIMSAVL
jgi:hypothetical protein